MSAAQPNVTSTALPSGEIAVKDPGSLAERKGNPPVLRGLTTVSFFADDPSATARWYAEVLDIEPYFTRSVDGRPVYIEFRIGDYQHELGIIDRRFSPHDGSGSAAGAVIYWHVDDVEAAIERLVSMGGTVHEKPIERGPGFVTASAIDPFGNILGVMHNPHYLEVLAARKQV